MLVPRPSATGDTRNHVCWDLYVYIPCTRCSILYTICHILCTIYHILSTIFYILYTIGVVFLGPMQLWRRAELRWPSQALRSAARPTCGDRVDSV